MALHLERLELVRRDTESIRDDVSDIHRSIERKLHAQKEALQRSQEMMNSIKGHVLKERHGMPIQEFRMALEMARKEGAGAKKLEAMIHDLEGHAEKVQRQLGFYSKKLEVLDQKSQLLKERSYQQKVEREAESVMELGVSRRFSEQQRLNGELLRPIEPFQRNSSEHHLSQGFRLSDLPDFTDETPAFQDGLVVNDLPLDSGSQITGDLLEQLTGDFTNDGSGGGTSMNSSGGTDDGETLGEALEGVVEGGSQERLVHQHFQGRDAFQGETDSGHGNYPENQEPLAVSSHELTPSRVVLQQEADPMHSQEGGSTPQHWSQGEHHRVTFTVQLSSDEKVRVQIERKIENKLSLLLLAEGGEVTNLKSIQSRLADRLQAAGYTLLSLRSIQEGR